MHGSDSYNTISRAPHKGHTLRRALKDHTAHCTSFCSLLQRVTWRPNVTAWTTCWTGSGATGTTTASPAPAAAWTTPSGEWDYPAGCRCFLTARSLQWRQQQRQRGRLLLRRRSEVGSAAQATDIPTRHGAQHADQRRCKGFRPKGRSVERLPEAAGLGKRRRLIYLQAQFPHWT